MTTFLVAAVSFFRIGTFSSIIGWHTSGIGTIRPSTFISVRANRRIRPLAFYCWILITSWLLLGIGPRFGELPVVGSVGTLVVVRVVSVGVAGRERLVVVGRRAVLAVADAGPGVRGGHGSRRGGGCVAGCAGVVRLGSRRPAVPRATRASSAAIRGHTYQSPLA